MFNGQVGDEGRHLLAHILIFCVVHHHCTQQCTSIRRSHSNSSNTSNGRMTCGSMVCWECGLTPKHCDAARRLKQKFDVLLLQSCMAKADGGGNLQSETNLCKKSPCKQSKGAHQRSTPVQKAKERRRLRLAPSWVPQGSPKMRPKRPGFERPPGSPWVQMYPILLGKALVS